MGIDLIKVMRYYYLVRTNHMSKSTKTAWEIIQDQHNLILDSLKDMSATDAKNSQELKSFIDYCLKNPEQRFWQALRNWSGWQFIGVSKDLKNWEDTFYWEKTKKI